MLEKMRLADIYNGTIKQGMAAHEAGMPYKVVV